MDLKPRNLQPLDMPTNMSSRHSRDHRFIHQRRPTKPKQYYLIVFLLITLCFLFTGVILLQFWPHSSGESRDGAGGDRGEAAGYRGLRYGKDVVITASSPPARPRDPTCTFYTCFDVYHCGYNDDNRISVYIYPRANHLDEEGLPITLPLSKEFHEVLQTVMDSIYYTNDPEKACLFLPPLDLLNQNNIRLKETSKILASLPRYEYKQFCRYYPLIPINTFLIHKYVDKLKFSSMRYLKEHVVQQNILKYRPTLNNTIHFKKRRNTCRLIQKSHFMVRR